MLNETLVAIEMMSNGKYRVIELPAQATKRHITRRRFGSAEAAENYIEEQYADRAVCVQPNDITAEIERRNAPPPHPFLAEVLLRLSHVLSELEAIGPLAPAGTVKDHEAHEAWMEQSKAMDDLYNGAVRTALWVVPNEVEAVLRKIRERYYGRDGKEQGDATPQ